MNLLLVVTGSLHAAYSPYLISRLQGRRPDVDIRVVRTRSARAYVTRPALQRLSHREVDDDEWELDAPGPVQHVELRDWADAVLVSPATMDYVARIANGERDTPSLLTIAVAGVPVVLAPVPPNGSREKRLQRTYLEKILLRPEFGVVAASRPSAAGTDAVCADVESALLTIDRLSA